MPRSCTLIGVLFWSILLAAVPAANAEKWKLQYFFDQDRETLNIRDLKCPTPRRCIAVGMVETEKGASKPTAVVTSDGGAHWALVSLKEPALALFMLDESLGWFAGPKNLWKSVESGRSWEKVGKLPPGILQIYFLDAKHGFAVGMHKTVMETTDGGGAWTPVAAAAEPASREEYTIYNCIEFVDAKNGVISGFSRPPRHEGSDLPDWVNPEKAISRRQWPTMSITLDTHDGGKTWNSSTASIFGQISRIHMTPAGVGLGLIGFTENFEWPAEIFRIDWKTGKSARTFREHNRKITDMALISGELAYIAGAEILGKLQQTPVPGKLKILKSTDLESWHEMEVDYRATAANAVMAGVDGKNVWVATDTGMILKLEP